MSDDIDYGCRKRFFFFFFSMTVVSLGVAQSCIVDLGVKGWTFLHFGPGA
jgi:uncharacterized membrane protein YczE